jgi:sugar lactone lactonase YvrE
VDGQGNVYVADSGNDRIQKFGSSGKFLSKWGSSGKGDGQFSHPKGIVVDGQGNVYVADYGNDRIQKFDGSGKFLSKWGSSGIGEGQFSSPNSLAVDGQGNVFVSDIVFDTVISRNNNRIQKFDPSGKFLTKWGSYGNGDGQFYSPGGVAVAVDLQGNVYVTDYIDIHAPENFNDRIQKFDNNGKFLSKWEVLYPIGVAVDLQGNVYAVESYSVIEKFDNNGKSLTTWGDSGNGDGAFDLALGVAVDKQGNVYVSDANSHRIQKFRQR